MSSSSLLFVVAAVVLLGVGVYAAPSGANIESLPGYGPVTGQYSGYVTVDKSGTTCGRQQWKLQCTHGHSHGCSQQLDGTCSTGLPSLKMTQQATH